MTSDGKKTALILLYLLYGLIGMVRSAKSEGSCMLCLGAVSASLVPAPNLYMEKSSIRGVAKGKKEKVCESLVTLSLPYQLLYKNLLYS